MMSFPAYESLMTLGWSLSSLIFVYLYYSTTPKKRALPWHRMLGYLLGCTVSAYWGARVLHDLISSGSENRLSRGFWDVVILDAPQGGLVFYGGLIGIIVFHTLRNLLLRLSPERENWNMLLNFLLPGLCIGHAIGRIGCFLRGCCYGDICPYFWGIEAEWSSQKIHPVQLYESFVLFVLGGILILKQKNKIAVFSKLQISTTTLYFLAYPLIRFSLEIFRGDEIRGFWGPMSTSQWISLILFVATILIIALNKMRAVSAKTFHSSEHDNA